MASILIVDDNHMIRDLLRMVLESGNHDVEEAADGDIALQCDVSRFDLVISDIFMPRILGYEVIRSAASHAVPTIVISGGDRLSGEDPLVKALEMGAALALRKPFSVAQIFQAVTECLSGAPTQPRVMEYGRI